MPRIRAVIADLRVVTPTVIELSVVREGGGVFPYFVPGQYSTISVPTYQRLRGARSFSIASSPNDLSTLKFGIRVHGDYTTALRGVRRGDRAIIGGPYGSFTFDPIRDTSVVFIAGGIGITPFMSMARTAAALNLPHDMTLLYSVRSLSDAPYLEELDVMQRANPHLHVVYAVSDGRVPDASRTYIPGRITREVFSRAVNEPGSKSYFLCGPQGFMNSMVAMLRSSSVSHEAIHMEKFAVSSSAVVERGSIVPKIAFAAWGTALALVFGVIVRIETAKRTANAAATSIPNDSSPIVNTSPTQGQTDTSTGTTSNSGSTTVTPTPAQTYTPPQTYYRVAPRTSVS